MAQTIELPPYPTDKSLAPALEAFGMVGVQTYYRGDSKFCYDTNLKVTVMLDRKQFRNSELKQILIMFCHYPINACLHLFIIECREILLGKLVFHPFILIISTQIAFDTSLGGDIEEMTLDTTGLIVDNGDEEVNMRMGTIRNGGVKIEPVGGDFFRLIATQPVLYCSVGSSQHFTPLRRLCPSP